MQLERSALSPPFCRKPQMFYPVNHDMQVIKSGDVLAARCTMVRPKKNWGCQCVVFSYQIVTQREFAVINWYGGKSKQLWFFFTLFYTAWLLLTL